MDTRGAWATVAITVLLCACVPACSRRWFRENADRDVYDAIREKGGHLDQGTIYPGGTSRLHDPFSPDCPPLPPDDLISARLMCQVDGKAGYDGWNKFGRTSRVEHVGYLEALPHDDNGTVTLDLQDAVRIARVNSRPYQQNLETLYRSALGVTFERFRFDHQLFAGTRVDEEFIGRKAVNGGVSETTVISTAGFEKLSATGSELMVGFANSLIWDSWGSNSDLFSSTINFTLMQPLLRLGGRARVLENLTQSERNLLANVRQMQQFRQGFYVDIVTGRNSGSGPSLSNNVGAGGLGLIAGTPGGRSGAPSAGGYLGLLQDQQQIRNQNANIAALRDSLAQLEAAFEANRITSRLQVDQARQALLNAQSTLLADKARYQTVVDGFKVDLGLPPDLRLKIQDDLLDRFVLIDPRLTELQEGLTEVLTSLRESRDEATPQLIADSLVQLASFDDKIAQRVDTAAEDLARLEERLPQRKEQLSNVGDQIKDLRADVDERVYDETVMMKRISFLKLRLPQISQDLAKLQGLRASLAEDLEPEHDEDDDEEKPDVDQEDDESDEVSSIDKQSWKALNALAASVSDLLLELSLVHAEIRLQGITLLPVDIEPQEAVASARLNRLDWMNARANLVDAWRRIEFAANDLKSDLDLEVDGSLATRPDNVLDFDDDRSRILLRLRFDTPTARVAERNRYRVALLDYQQARRDFMQFEDQISLSLRNTIRIIELSQINLEVRRAAVQVAIAQVDIARLRLNPPARPDQPSRTSPTAARDLVDALGDLLDAQNDLLNVWVSYEVLRVLLDFEMGTMQLDPNGSWIDPGPVNSNKMPGLLSGEGFGDEIANLGGYDADAEMIDSDREDRLEEVEVLDLTQPQKP